MSMSGIHHKTEAGLFRRGFKVPEVRKIVRNQIYLLGVTLIVAAAFGWIEPIFFHFAAGVILITYNFYSLAKFVQQIVFFSSSRRAVVELLIRFYGRLLLTGAVLFALIVWAGVSVPALLAGLSTVIMTILFWGASQMLGHKAKEA
jgi:hypothetical protein